MRVGRRAFLRTLALAAPGSSLRPRAQARSWREPLAPPRAPRESSVLAALRSSQPSDTPDPTPPYDLPFVDLASAGRTLRRRFRDLRRHFVFEYYPWYRSDPWFHWDEGGHHPPVDLATNYVPRLGPYDSRARRVLEQHARWIAETGAGAINVSWWGPGSYEDDNVPLVMDVMRDHDLHVAFHLEPYRDDRAAVYPQDVLYLIRRYGDRRGWDCFLLLENADGASGPVFKSFRTILPERTTDCHGVTTPVPDYTPDGFWSAQLRQVRQDLKNDFDHVTLLADSLAIERTATAGFDGIAVYDNFVDPPVWVPHARRCSAVDLLFSFNTNPGFDAVVRRDAAPGSCYEPPPFEPETASIDWQSAAGRLRAARSSTQRIHESFEMTVALQTDPTLPNARRGFFLVYLNSFNEWFEGHQFEPMQDDAQLSAAERALSYHNPPDGDYRRKMLTSLLDRILSE